MCLRSASEHISRNGYPRREDLPWMWTELSLWAGSQMSYRGNRKDALPSWAGMFYSTSWSLWGEGFSSTMFFHNDILSFHTPTGPEQAHYDWSLWNHEPCQPCLFSQVLSSRQSLAPQVRLIYYPVIVWFCWRLRISGLASICVITGQRFTRVVHVMCGDQDPIQIPPYPPCHVPGVFPGSIVQAIPWLRKTAMYLHWMGGLLSMGLLSESLLTCPLLWVKTLGCSPTFSPDVFFIIPKSSPKFPKYSDSVCCYWAVHV